MKNLIEHCINCEKRFYNENSIAFEEKTIKEVAHYEETKKKCCSNKTLTLIKSVAGGQLLSLLLCGYGTFITALGTLYGIHTPCFNASITYGIIAFTFGICVLARKNNRKILQLHWWKFLIVTFIEVEGNFLITKAYGYTTLTSVQLCDSLTIPTVMVISFIFLRIRYKVIHYLGVAMCLAGSVLLVSFDKNDKKNNATHELTGDIMALSGAILYGIANAGQEVLVKEFSPLMYLGTAGIYGFIISALQTVILERNLVRDIVWSYQIALLFIGCGIFQYFYFSTMPHVMKISNATVANLSLLTADLFTLLVGLFLFRYKFSYVFFIAFGFIIVGLVVYNVKPAPEAQKKQETLKKKETIYSTFNSDSQNIILHTKELV
ncbi:solute carrier family 35 member F2 [Hydra vulgaris]|uniref:Solute carrier family 35 member F2 n=1 Tax=Hydra vulgaris TaxID=6087 RepID=A0ABM4BKL0_HYDVU